MGNMIVQSGVSSRASLTISENAQSSLSAIGRTESAVTASGLSAVDLTQLTVMNQGDTVLDYFSGANYAAYSSSAVQSLSAGGTYTDPITGVTIIRLTDATHPTTNSTGGHSTYSDSGPWGSHPWQSGSQWYVTQFISINQGTSYWLVDVDITNVTAPTVSNYRALSGNYNPSGPISFCWSVKTDTPRIFYVLNGNYIRKYDSSTWPPTEVTDSPFPYNFGSSLGAQDAFFRSDLNEDWFSFKDGAGDGYCWQSSTDTLRGPYAVGDEWHMTRDGTYAHAFNSGSQAVYRLSDGASIGNSSALKAHVASVRGGFIGHDYAVSGQEYKLIPSASLSETVANNRGWYKDSVHHSGCWIQPSVPINEQYYSGDCGGPTNWPTDPYALGGCGFSRMDNDHGVVVCGHYSSPYTLYFGGDYWSTPFQNPSAGAHIFTFTSWMCYGDSNPASRYDLFAAILPRSS